MVVAKLTKLEKEALALLPEIAVATLGPVGYLFADSFTTQYLVEEGLVEVNVELTDEEGNAATRATEKGINFVKSTSEVQNTKGSEQNMEAKAEFVIESGIEIPKTQRGGGAGNSKYPFDKLEVGQSFFVAKESKTLGGTVSSANKRYAKETGEMRTNRKGNQVAATVQERMFVARAVEGGTRIWRTA